MPAHGVIRHSERHVTPIVGTRHSAALELVLALHEALRRKWGWCHLCTFPAWFTVFGVGMISAVSACRRWVVYGHVACKSLIIMQCDDCDNSDNLVQRS